MHGGQRAATFLPQLDAARVCRAARVVREHQLRHSWPDASADIGMEILGGLPVAVSGTRAMRYLYFACCGSLTG